MCEHCTPIQCLEACGCSENDCFAHRCEGCGHPEGDHGPHSGRWQDEKTEEFTVIIPGRLCYHEENAGHCEDLCPCMGFTTIFDIFAHRGYPCWLWYPGYFDEQEKAGGGSAE